MRETMSAQRQDASQWDELRGLCLDPFASEYDVVKVSDALHRVVESVSYGGLPDAIAMAVEQGIFTVDEATLLLGVASYSAEDDGAQMRRILEGWLEDTGDESRVAMALGEGTVPFRSRAQRVAVLTSVAARFPKFAAKCNYFIDHFPHD